MSSRYIVMIAIALFSACASSTDADAKRSIPAASSPRPGWRILKPENWHGRLGASPIVDEAGKTRAVAWRRRDAVEVTRVDGQGRRGARVRLSKDATDAQVLVAAAGP